MSMPELTDDQLDALFRKSAEEVETPFDPAAWQDMNARLNTHDRTGATGNTALLKKLLRWGLPLALLLLFVGGWYGLNRFSGGGGGSTGRPNAEQSSSEPALESGNGQRINRLVEAKGTNDTAEARQATTSAPAFVEPESRKQKQIDELAYSADKANKKAGSDAMRESGKGAAVFSEETTVSTHKSIATKTVVRPKQIHREGTALLPLANGVPKGQTTELQNRRFANLHRKTNHSHQSRSDLANEYAETEKVPFNGQLGHTAGETTETSSVESESNPPIPDVDAPPAVALPMLTKLSSRAAVWPRLMPLMDHPVMLPIKENTTQRVASQPAKIGRGLSVRFVVSPDLSAVGLKNFTRPGTNVGLLLEYRLAARWSFQAGVMQSTKVYRAATSDYAMPAYTTKWPAQPYGVNGTCNMIDIPLNVRYDVALRPRQNGQAPSRWFVSGGVTSYIMKQEDYAYQYDDPSDPRILPKNWGWSGRTGAYGFSELNLSAGYERAISHRFSWQVEPYLKVPLKGVGYYKINLLSTGGFFSLRYKF